MIQYNLIQQNEQFNTIYYTHIRESVLCRNPYAGAYLNTTGEQGVGLGIIICHIGAGRAGPVAVCRPICVAKREPRGETLALIPLQERIWRVT